MYIQSDLDDQTTELKVTEESMQRAASDVTRLAEELRMEQEQHATSEKARKNLEHHLKELQSRLDESETSSVRGKAG